MWGCGSIPIKTEAAEPKQIGWSSDLDHVPLIQRQKILLANKYVTAPKQQIQATPQTNVAVKQEEEQCDSQALFSFPSSSPVSNGTEQQLVQRPSHETKSSSEHASVVALNEILVDSVAIDHFPPNGNSFKDLRVPGVCNSQEANLKTIAGPGQPTGSKVNTKGIEVEKVDSTASTLAYNNMIFEKPTIIKVDNTDNLKSSLVDNVNGFARDDVQTVQLKSNDSNDFADDLDHIVLKQRLRMLQPRTKLGLERPFQEEMLVELNSCDRLDFVPDGISSLTLLNSVRVKSELVDNSDLVEQSQNAVNNATFNLVPIRSEPEIFNTPCGDKVDDMHLRDRLSMQTNREVSESNTFGDSECLRKVVPTAVDCGPTVSETPIPIKIQRPRKRKKTATDSVETALEEDAPGLLQVLIDQGISVDEIKLYGEPESDELIDESFIEEGFAEFEAVISKLFFQRNSLLKLAPVRCTKGSKPTYCLACLFSLVEQARYLRFRSWPAEWGWCRDLQSFIFVFERHNRIVLERPEYGYATYFFELMDSLPITWQVKRLVTAMKLTSCGRILLIENKALTVGEDLTEGEAQVLMQCGWTPNSSLGTMLNYCDRVVHDRKNEKDSSEWRSKIGKLLMDGYNGGTIVSTNIDTEVTENRGGESSQIKMEI